MFSLQGFINNVTTTVIQKFYNDKKFSNVVEMIYCNMG